MASNTVKLNGQEYTIQRFKGLKAVLAIAGISRISREVPDILAKATKEYSQRNTLTLTPELAKLPRWQDAGFTDEDFEAAGGKIELPAPMSQQEQVLVALPELMTQARKETTRLLAILLIPNEELKEADRSDEVEEALDKYGDLLLYEADLDELADLVIVAGDVLQEQLGEKRDRLGKVVTQAIQLFRRTRPSTQDMPLESILKTSTLESQISSTSSPAATDGIESTSSLVSPGAS